MNRRTPTPTAQRAYLCSERYRQMLVRDGERRFHEWHTAFIKYQAACLADLKRRQAGR